MTRFLLLSLVLCFISVGILGCADKDNSSKTESSTAAPTKTAEPQPTGEKPWGSDTYESLEQGEGSDSK